MTCPPTSSFRSWLRSGEVEAIEVHHPVPSRYEVTDELHPRVRARIDLCQSPELDDTLGVWLAHGIGGFVGVLLTGLFAEAIVNPAGNNGLLFGNPGQLGVQAAVDVAVVAYAFAVALVIVLLIDRFVGRCRSIPVLPQYGRRTYRQPSHLHPSRMTWEPDGSLLTGMVVT
jgi:hypothetical protein